MENKNTYKNNNSINLLILGDSGTGKTSLIHSMIYNEFYENIFPTRGSEFNRKTYEIIDSPKQSREIFINFMDISGQEKYLILSESTISKYINWDSIILVYSIDNKDSFNNLETIWIELINKYFDIKSKLLWIIGNKCDLEKERRVTKEEEKELCEKYNANFVLCSAKANINIMELYENIIKKILELKNDDNFGDKIITVKRTRYRSVCPFFSDYYTEEYEEKVRISNYENNNKKKKNKKCNS